MQFPNVHSYICNLSNGDEYMRVLYQKMKCEREELVTWLTASLWCVLDETCILDIRQLYSTSKCHCILRRDVSFTVTLSAETYYIFRHSLNFAALHMRSEEWLFLLFYCMPCTLILTLPRRKLFRYEYVSINKI